MVVTLQFRRIVTFVAVLIVIVGAFILLRPRVWVKNKTAKVIVDGRLSEDVKLYHGSDGRVLFYLADDPPGMYYYNMDSGIQRCDASEFAKLEILVFSPAAFPQCGSLAAATSAKEQSLEFRRRDQQIIVSWQAAPR